MKKIPEICTYKIHERADEEKIQTMLGYGRVEWGKWGGFNNEQICSLPTHSRDALIYYVHVFEKKVLKNGKKDVSFALCVCVCLYHCYRNTHNCTCIKDERQL